MAGSPAAQVIDSLARDVLVAPLKELGFRKKARHWSWSRGDVHRGVTVQASQFNVASDVRFTVEVGVSFEALGHPRPESGAWGAAVSRRLSGLRRVPIDDWFAFDVADNATIDRARSALEAAWSDFGLPFIRAVESPEGLCDHVIHTGNAELALEVLEQVAAPLGDHDRQAALATRAAQQAAQRGKWRYLPNDPHPLELGLHCWASVARAYGDLGLQLDDVERQAARAVLDDATSGMLATRFHGDQDRADAAVLRSHLD